MCAAWSKIYLKAHQVFTLQKLEKLKEEECPPVAPTGSTDSVYLSVTEKSL